jgi:uncharacterized protein YlzI (FlbEa/FlbD family)
MAKFIAFKDGRFSGELYVNIEHIVEIRPDAQPNFSTILRLVDGREIIVAGKYAEVVDRLNSA